MWYLGASLGTGPAGGRRLLNSLPEHPPFSQDSTGSTKKPEIAMVSGSAGQAAHFQSLGFLRWFYLWVLQLLTMPHLGRRCRPHDTLWAQGLLGEEHQEEKKQHGSQGWRILRFRCFLSLPQTNKLQPTHLGSANHEAHGSKQPWSLPTYLLGPQNNLGAGGRRE